MQKNRIVSMVVLTVIICLYCAVSAIRLNMPGLYYDECLFVNAATGSSSGPFIYKAILGIPVMIFSYTGALKSYCYYPVFHLFGISAATIRLPVIVFSTATIIFCFLLGKRLFGRSAAFLLAGLVATDPAFIYNVRLDFGPVAFMLLFKMAALYFFFEFLARQRPGYALLLALSLLLGFFDKLNFIWFICALPVAAVVLYGRELLALFSAHRRYLLILLALFLLCMTFGIVTLVIPVLSTPGGMPVLGIIDRIAYLVNVFLFTMAGSWPFMYVMNSGDLPRTFANFLMIPAAAAIAAALWFRVKKGTTGGQGCDDRALWFFVVLSVLIAVEIIITKQAGGPHHLMMLYPFHYLILFAGVELVRRRLPERFARSCMISCLVGYFVAAGGQLYADYRYIDAFTEGKSYRAAWDPAIYRLSAFLEKSGADLIYCADWGLQAQLFALASPGNRGKYVDVSGMLKRVNPDDPRGARFLYLKMFQGANACVALMDKESGIQHEGGENFLKFYRNSLQTAAFHEKIGSSEGKGLYEVFGITGR